jgi:hypothetical protein
LSGGGGKGVVASGGCVEVVAPMVCLESNNNGAQKNARCELTGKCHDCDGRNANQSPPSGRSFRTYGFECGFGCGIGRKSAFRCFIFGRRHETVWPMPILIIFASSSFFCFFTMSFPLFSDWLACSTMVGQPQSRLLSLLDQNEQWINSVC